MKLKNIIYTIIILIVFSLGSYYLWISELRPERDLQKEFKSNNCLMDVANSYCISNGFEKLQRVYVNSYDPKWRFGCYEIQDEHNWRDPTWKTFKFIQEELKECGFNG